MNEQIREHYDEQFRKMEKYSTKFVIILFLIILIIHTFIPLGSWQEITVKILFRICLISVIVFILAEFLKDFFYPFIAMFHKPNLSEKKND